ncbi:MAG: DUF2344 domain-containing protein [Clostridia bacterium]|nr:DUF2344 domain-containing protein [Clostridia bacterium]
MVKYRFKFTKEGDAKYVSQLDLVRLFTRVFKRAEIALTYSQGFNPHPKMSIGLPLGIGVTSECEFLDAELEEKNDPMEILKKLNASAPIGIRFTAMQEICEFSPKVKDAESAIYTVKTEGVLPTQSEIDEFLKSGEINVLKKTKSGEKMTDISPDIFEIEKMGENELFMRLRCAPNINLKPETVVLAMNEFIENADITDFDVHRTRILDRLGRDFS